MAFAAVMEYQIICDMDASDPNIVQEIVQYIMARKGYGEVAVQEIGPQKKRTFKANFSADRRNVCSVISNTTAREEFTRDQEVFRNRIRDTLVFHKHRISPGNRLICQFREYE